MYNDEKLNNPFRNQGFQPNGSEASAGPRTATLIADPVSSTSNSNSTYGFEDLSIQPGNPQSQNFYTSLPDGPPPAYDRHHSPNQLPIENGRYSSETGEGNNDASTKGLPSIPSEEAASSSRSPEARGGVYSSFRSSGSNNASVPAPANTYNSLGEPPSFLRSPPHNISYAPFPSTYLVSIGKKLDQGFPPLPPPSDMQPHPFFTHDVNEGDWTSFLESIRVSAAPTKAQKVATNVLIPVARRLPIVGAVLSNPAVEKHIQKQEVGEAVKVIDLWNNRFFRARRIEVILTQGQHRLNTCSSPIVPSLHAGREEGYFGCCRSNSAESSSSSSSSDDGYNHNQRTCDKKARKAAKREMRAERKAAKRQIRMDKRAVTMQMNAGRPGMAVGCTRTDTTYRLFVVAI